MVRRPLPLCLAATVMAGTIAPAMAQTVPIAPPPDRVGRIAAITGAVSFHLAGATAWQAASRNLPVTTGTVLWVAPGGEAALGVADSRVVLAPATELDMDQLDDQALASTQPQGESYWHLRTVPAADTYVVRTPRGTVTIATAGRYDVASGDTAHPTTITVLDGVATVTGLAASQEIGPGQTLTITGDGSSTPFTANLGPASQDAFLTHALAEEAPARPRAPLAPAILGAMTGAEALYGEGEWAENAEYGPVWYPPAADYVPYRQGRWAYVAPWGWTWVDDAPWGFAPSHYGRWSQFGGRWGWVPGRDWAAGQVPAYAPALVGFLGGAALGVGLGAGHGPLVGWAPLGPHDAYRPPYAADPRVVQILNRPTGATIQINTINNIENFGNRTALTVVPRQDFVRSAPVADALRGGPAPRFPAASFQYRAEAMPTRGTIGATNAVLRQVNPAGLAAPALHAGPGPEFGPGPELRGPGSAMPQVAPSALGGSALGGSALGGSALGGSVVGGAALGGVALGAVGGGLLHRPGPAALPALRERGDRPPALRPAGVGEIVHPRPPGGIGQPGGPRPEPFAAPRVAPVEGPARPALPTVRYGAPSPERPHLPDVHYGMPPQARPEGGPPDGGRRAAFDRGPRPEQGPRGDPGFHPEQGRRPMPVAHPAPTPQAPNPHPEPGPRPGPGGGPERR